MARSSSRALSKRVPAATALALRRVGIIGSRSGDRGQRLAGTSRRAALAELKGGADANTRAADGTTALHWAAHHDNVELVAGLIAAGADPNAVNDYGATPLSEAAVVGNPAVDRATARRGRRRQRARQGWANATDGPRARQQRRSGAAAARAWRRRERQGSVAATDCIDLGGRSESTRDGEAAARARRRSRTLAPRRRTWERQVSAEKRRLFRPVRRAHCAHVRGTRRAASIARERSSKAARTSIFRAIAASRR